MPPRRYLQKRSVFDKSELLARFRQRGIKEIHAWNLWSHIIKHRGHSWQELNGLPKAALEILDTEFAVSTIKRVKSQDSGDGETTKLLLELQDGLRIETVIMRYDTRGCIPYDPSDEVTMPGNPRSTVCVSSQVGCRMGCTFCATGTMGLMANLTSGEIVEQLLIAREMDEFRNVVFMGMGEPLDNYDSVRDAIHFLTDPRCFCRARHRITVSTVGVHNKFNLMAEELPGISLAFSLHAPTQELRQQIVPSARAYKLENVMEALNTYQSITKQRIFVEYVLLAGVNDTPEQAQHVGELLQGKDIVLNLIPFNPIYARGINFQAPNQDTIATFQAIITNGYGIRCIVRKEKGQDISSACGQLAVTDVEDLVIG